MYVNYGYYESKYLLGREPTVPEDDFLFWEKQTERVLNQYTFVLPERRYRAFE